MTVETAIDKFKYIVFFLLLCWIFYPEKSYTFIVSKDTDSGPEESYVELIAPPEFVPTPKPFRASLRCFRPIHPSDIPDTKPWWYRGSGTLRDHLRDKHLVLPEMMALFEQESDLKKLHSFLHNGGSLSRP